MKTKRNYRGEHIIDTPDCRYFASRTPHGDWKITVEHRLSFGHPYQCGTITASWQRRGKWVAFYGVDGDATDRPVGEYHKSMAAAFKAVVATHEGRLSNPCREW